MAILNGYTNTLAAGIQDYIFGYNSYVPGTTFYIGLSTTEIQADGTAVTEPVGFDYARVASPQSWWNVATTVADVAVTTNSQDLTFPTATGLWGTIVSAGIFTAPTGGIVLFGGLLTTPKLIDDQTVAVFLTDDFVLNSTNQ